MYELIIMDLYMPICNGLEATKSIRKYLKKGAWVLFGGELDDTVVADEPGKYKLMCATSVFVSGADSLGGLLFKVSHQNPLQYGMMAFAALAEATQGVPDKHAAYVKAATGLADYAMQSQWRRDVNYGYCRLRAATVCRHAVGSQDRCCHQTATRRGGRAGRCRRLARTPPSRGGRTSRSARRWPSA